MNVRNSPNYMNAQNVRNSPNCMNAQNVRNSSNCMKKEYITPDKKVYIIRNFFPAELERDIVSKLESECVFGNFLIGNKIIGRTGSFEGDQFDDGSTPWLRCPSIEQQTILPWSPSLGQMRDIINQKFGVATNIAKLQKYENGREFINTHSDKILDLDKRTPIFVARFGATRSCTIVRKNSDMAIFFKIPHNCLLVINYDANLDWTHGIVPDQKVNEPSYSIVFRHSVTRRIDRFVFGERTPFKTKEDLDKRSTRTDMWSRDQFRKKITACYSLENRKRVGLNIYSDIMKYCPHAF